MGEGKTVRVVGFRAHAVIEGVTETVEEIVSGGKVSMCCMAVRREVKNGAKDCRSV